MKHTGAHATLTAVIHLHCVNLVRKNVAWYLINEIISAEAAAELDALHDAAVKALVPHMNTAVEALGLYDIENLHTPITRDFQAFNAQNDFENFDAAGPLFDFRTTGTLQQAKL